MHSRGGDRRGTGTRFGSVSNPMMDQEGYAYSDDGSSADGGRNGIPRTKSSTHAQHLANEIANIEQRNEFLETRNKLLNDKLLRNQRQFIERTLMSNTKNLAKNCFKAWHDSMDMLRVESQLHQQTASLDKCQQVAKELGSALAREQNVSAKHTDARRQLEVEFEELFSSNSQLKEYSGAQTEQIRSLQRQLSMALGGLDSIKNDAQSSIDSVEQLQARVRDLKKQDDVGMLSETATAAPVPRPFQADSGERKSAIEESMLKRDEAQLVMQSMSTLLATGNSPDRERVRKSSSQSQANRFDPAERSSSRSIRSPSPMDNRFQTVNQIVAELEQAPSVASGSDLLQMGYLQAGQSVASGGTSPTMMQNREMLGGGIRSQNLGDQQRSPIFGRSQSMSAGSSLLKR